MSGTSFAKASENGTEYRLQSPSQNYGGAGQRMVGWQSYHFAEISAFYFACGFAAKRF